MEVPVLPCLILIYLQTYHGFPTTTEFHAAKYENISYNELSGGLQETGEGRSRQSRKILRKIHNGIAFLTGVKVGSLLANKGFDSGHGSLAASNSFRIFGKSVNSAISLSYGSIGPKLPLVDDVSINDTQKRKAVKDKQDIVHLTIVHNPSADTIEKLKQISSVSMAEPNQNYSEAVNDVIVIETDEELYQNLHRRKSEEGSNFLKNHNDRINAFNREIKRRNSKF